MLEELSVRNYALIDSLNIQFEGGLNIVTGETGAGKSIIIGSLGFLLGGKADVDCIRTGADEAAVSAVISIKEGNVDALSWLAARDIRLDDGRIVVRRNLKSNARSSLYIQNIPVSRVDMASFMEFLFDIHGQHEHESLLRKETHRKYLDRFAGIESEVNDFYGVFLKLAEKRKTLEASASSQREKKARIEILSFAVEEIEAADLKSGESRQLEAEAARLSSYEKLMGFAESASLSLFESSDSVLSLSRKARSAIEGAASMDDTLSAISSRVGALYFEAEDLSAEMRSYRDKLSYDPDRLLQIQERLSLIYKLKKKYVEKNNGSLFTTEDDILEYKNSAALEIEALSSSEENREKLKDEISVIEKEIARRARDLTAKRSAASSVLSSKITEILSSLGMSGARFDIRLLAKEREGQTASMLCGPYGADDIEFLISANKGEPLKELLRIASGGELSRIMLAIKTVLSLDDGADCAPDTLVFDEIDTGVGGEVAIAVGEYLCRTGKKKQIFCITHLASIACRADNHLLVEKKTDGQRTTTTVQNLNAKERRSEVARMLSGERGETALLYADELLTKYEH